jgi:hypothetical protein
MCADTRARPGGAARAAAVTFLLAALVAAPAAASPARAGHTCVGEDSASVRAAGDAPPQFTAPFFAHTFTIDASADGLDGQDLPVSIESICDVPRSLVRQARQLAGSDGVAVLNARTAVWQGRTRLTGEAAITALDGADTAVLRVRLVPRAAWREDEDGEPVATFAARRVEITD